MACFNATGDNFYLTKPYYETVNSSPDYSVPIDATKLAVDQTIDKWRYE